jgi:CRP-like cAMP-binding protein
MQDSPDKYKHAITCDCYNCELKELFYKNVADTEVQSICEKKFELSFKKGEIIISQGEPIKYFAYLKTGLAKVFRTYQNREQIISITQPMDFIGILGILSNENYNYSVIALEDCVICNLDIGLIKHICQVNTNFTLSVLEKTNKLYDKIVIEGLKIRQKHLRGRVAYILLLFAREIYQVNRFELPITRKEIAEYIGMTTENVIRTFSEFRKDGLLQIHGKTIVILDPQRMGVISDFG